MLLASLGGLASRVTANADTPVGQPHHHHIEMVRTDAAQAKQLVTIFCAWKALLLLVAAFCPGPGYDTSALILSDASPHRHSSHLASSQPSRLGLNLLRWDALYFAKAAERGVVYEQEWAFSPAYSRLLHFAAQSKATPDKRLGRVLTVEQPFPVTETTHCAAMLLLAFWFPMSATSSLCLCSIVS